MNGELTLDVSEHEDLYSDGLQTSVNTGAFPGTMLVTRTEQDLEWCNGRMRNPYVDNTDSREVWVAARRCQAVASRGMCTSLPVAA
jgi:hypothetical protein